MTRCANWNKKWQAKVIWSIINRPLDGKNCPHCNRLQYMKAETFQFMSNYGPGMIFILLFPFFVELSNEKEPWDKFD